MKAAGLALLLALGVAQATPVLAEERVAPRTGPLTVDSTVGELLANPSARTVLVHQLPILVNNPQIAQASALSLRSLAQYVPTLLTPEKLIAIDAELARTPGAVATANSPQPVGGLSDPRIALDLRTVRLWEGRAPGATGERPQDVPTLTVVGTDGAPSFGTAVIVAPGGGYKGLATGLEGRQVADWFAAQGVTAFVLTYRLTPFGYHHPSQLQDAQRAIRWVRAHADDYGIDPHRVGMIGFSAGGHLTAMAETLFDAGDPGAADPIERESSRPDFAVLGYAVTDPDSMSSGLDVAGPHPTAQTLRALAPVRNVRADTPPTFIFHTSADELVSSPNATRFYDALRAAGVPAEMHIFANGRHGLGLGGSSAALSVWPGLLRTWLEGLGLLGARD
jgi:acetyl esterase/lipase